MPTCLQHARLVGASIVRAIAPVVAMVVWSGCHPSASAVDQRAPTPALIGHAIGDSATYGIRILALDRTRETAEFSGTVTKHILVLAVVPGREIEVIDAGGTALPRGRSAGASRLAMQRFDDARLADADADARARLAYDRCVAQAEAEARRATAARRPVKRDSAGRVILDEGKGGTADVDMQRAYERRCDRLAAATNTKAAPKPMPPRAPAERYLMVLSSDMRVPQALLQERLATLTAVAPDAATTLEAIAAGVYAGLASTWGGYYVRW